MSTSFIYHALGMSDYEYVGQKFFGGAIIIHVQPKWRIIKCPLCGNKEIIRKGFFARRLRTVPIGQKPVWILVDIPRVYCPNGKGKAALEPFRERIHRDKFHIEAVSTDLGPAYFAAVMDNLPGVPLVFDRFHVVKLMNDVLTEIRRGLYNEYKDIPGKNVLKGTRWLLLKNPENLSASNNEAGRLKEALKMNEPLALVYYMKEDLRQFWEQPDKKTAEKVINDWIERAQSSGIRPLRKMARTIAMFKFGILNWYDHPISSGRLEGANNKIKVLKRMAYGYRDVEFFKLRILAIHEARYAFTG